MRLTLLLLFISSSALAQQGWTWTALPDMPEPVANNSVVEGWCGDSLCVYSFCGIDSTKVYSGIHNKAFRYNTVSQTWSVLPNVPDPEGKIAAGASLIQNHIYLAGGYYVYANGSEISSDDLHVFDPETGTWLADAPVIPTPIDDHVQTTYNDSLLMLVTGWSDTGNVNDVQLFDVTSQTWQAASEPPSSTVYTAFGASGAMAGDTLYYLGGVSNTFAANSAVRKGEINPLDATDINWSFDGQSPTIDDTYRSACSTYLDKLVWIGGAGIAYNYNGLAYSGGAGVPPLDRILTYHPASDSWQEILGTPESIMDLRGIAKISDNQWIVCGGMGPEQEVSNKTFLLTFDAATSVQSLDASVPWNIQRSVKVFRATAPQPFTAEVWSIEGRLLCDFPAQSELAILRSDFPSSSIVVLRSLDRKAVEGVRL